MVTNAVIYICSINDKSSLNSLENYFDLFLRIKETNIYPRVLNVNKIDLPESEHQITKKMVDEFLDEIIKKNIYYLNALFYLQVLKMKLILMKFLKQCLDCVELTTLLISLI